MTQWLVSRWWMTRWLVSRWWMTGWWMTRWWMTRWLVSRWLMTRWLVSRWLMTRWLMTRWLMTQWLMTLGHPSHPRRKRPVSMNLEQRLGTSFDFLLFSHHLINSRSKQLILLKRVLDFSRHVSSKINAPSGYIQWAALIKPRLRRVTAWDKPFDFFCGQAFRRSELVAKRVMPDYFNRCA